jgi:hypothetical protein
MKTGKGTKKIISSGEKFHPNTFNQIQSSSGYLKLQNREFRLKPVEACQM